MQGPDQRPRIRVYGERDWQGIRRTNAHFYGVGPSLLSDQDIGWRLMVSAPQEDQVARAKSLAEDLLVVLRVEYAKARGDHGHGGYQGYQHQQQGYGQQQADPYAGYYQVSFGSGSLFIIINPVQTFFYFASSSLSNLGTWSNTPDLLLDWLSGSWKEADGIATARTGRYTDPRFSHTRRCWCCCGRSRPGTGIGSVGPICRLLGRIWLRRQ